MSADRKVPEIRFKGFSGEWNSLMLGENAKFTKGQGYSKGDLVESGSPIILYGRLYTKYQTVISSIDTFVTEKDKSVKSIGGEVIIPASGELPEDISRASVVSKENVILGGDLNVVLPNKNIHSIFLALVISNGRIKKKLSSKAQGKSVVHIRNSDLVDLIIILPSEDIEQTQIGNYFQKLDTLINQHQNKHNKLCNIKKAMLEKMFPKQGETIPEIRFKGFSGEWEEIKFKDMAEIKRGLTYKPTDLVDEGVVVLRSSNINIDKFELRKDDVQVDKKAVNINYINNGDILITSANGSSQLVGKHAVVKNLNIDSVHGGFMLAATTNAPDFLNASMNTYWYNRFLSMNVSGGNGAIGNIKGSILEEEQLYVPKKDERDKIGNYFQKLDDLIAQHQQQITKLNNIKQACLSKMFV